MQPHKPRDRRKAKEPLTLGARRACYRPKTDPAIEQHETSWGQIGDHQSQPYPSCHTGIDEKEIPKPNLESIIKNPKTLQKYNSRAIKEPAVT
jgi:hypothetical protein